METQLKLVPSQRNASLNVAAQVAGPGVTIVLSVRACPERNAIKNVMAEAAPWREYNIGKVMCSSLWTI